MIKKLSEPEVTVLELTIGILVFGILLQAMGILLFKDLFFYSMGLWVGVVVAVLMAVHMYKVIDAGISTGDAEGYICKRAIIRYAAVVLVFAIVMLAKIGNPLSCFAGVMGLKASAYLQPFTHKLYQRITKSSTDLKEE